LPVDLGKRGVALAGVVGRSGASFRQWTWRKAWEDAPVSATWSGLGDGLACSSARSWLLIAN